ADAAATELGQLVAGVVLGQPRRRAGLDGARAGVARRAARGRCGGDRAGAVPGHPATRGTARCRLSGGASRRGRSAGQEGGVTPDILTEQLAVHLAPRLGAVTPAHAWGVFDDGRLVHVRGGGMAEADAARTAFRIASCTKSFTAAAARSEERRVGSVRYSPTHWT